MIMKLRREDVRQAVKMVRKYEFERVKRVRMII